MDLLQQIVARAKANKQRIVLPEAEEERTLKAADRVLADDLADLILIGNPDNIKKLAAEWGLQNIDKATIIDPLNNPKSEEYAELLAELRKKKDVKNRGVLTTQQLQEKIQRLQMEKQLKELTEAELHPGRKATKQALSSIGTKVATTALTGAALYGLKALVSKKFDGGELGSAIFNGGPKKK